MTLSSSVIIDMCVSGIVANVSNCLVSCMLRARDLREMFIVNGVIVVILSLTHMCLSSRTTYMGPKAQRIHLEIRE